MMTIYDGYYGSSAAAAPGEAGPGPEAEACVKRAVNSPAARLCCAVALAALGVSALAVLGEVPGRIADATPALADVETWLVWGDLRRF